MTSLATRHQPPATRRRPAATPSLRFALGRRGDLTLSASATADSGSTFRSQLSGLRLQRKRSAIGTRPASLVTRHSSLVTRRAAAFTLIELLVVIAIIAILAGLGFAGMQGAMESSKRAQARNDVHQIASAVKAYLLEYGRLPEKGNEIAALTGTNPKKIVFLEAKAARGKPPKGGLSGNTMLDPWGTTYVVIPDDNNDNKITHRGATHLTTVIVETIPPGDNPKPINNVQ